MVDTHSSEAYNKGFTSEYYDNPYAVGSDEYNECERGWAQRIKRGYRCKTSKKINKSKTFQQKYQNSNWN
jgi:hypothetical protein